MREQERMIGNSLTLTQALEQVSRLAAINRPVLVIGERGTGKELVAERLHYLSPRWEGPLLKVNCAAIADQLLESELFGHEPGAFTGASRTHRGRFERADGGTLFLDELATMSSGLQEKLLRLIEYGEYERLGGHTTQQADVRVIGATNADLPALVEKGEFRADLLDRLSFDVVHLPPLRHRLSDVPELAHHFAVQMCGEMGWELFPGFTDEAAMTLLRHPWPGNVRELKNAVERSVSRWGDPATAVAEIALDPFTSPFADWTGPSEGPLVASTEPPPLPDPLPDPPGVPSEGPVARDFVDAVKQYERDLLQSVMQQHNHQGRAAAALGLSYDQLRGLLKKHALTNRRRKPAAA
jgi:psp operon transcriptional activator